MRKLSLTTHALLFALTAQILVAQNTWTNSTITVQSKQTSGLPPDILSLDEREILNEVNLARSNPSQYARYLKEFERSYDGRELRLQSGSLITNEGVAALQEAIGFLESARPLPPLEIRKGMVLGAQDHLSDLTRSGKTGHRGSDGSITEDRLSRYGTWKDSVGENIVYDSRTARASVIGLIVDDGLSSRAHRNNIFKPTFRVIGIALGKPAPAGTLCVMTFAADYFDRSSKSTETKSTETKSTDLQKQVTAPLQKY